MCVYVPMSMLHVTEENNQMQDKYTNALVGFLNMYIYIYIYKL